MAKTAIPKATLIIAGPGAGKTHNMVNEIIMHLPTLAPCRFMAVITHTNAATNNIRERLSKIITIPPNLFIGTIHSFLNKFIVIPYSSFNDAAIPQEKLFVQFGIDAAYNHIHKQKPLKADDFKGKAALRKRIVVSLKNKGYITFDQTLVLAKDAISIENIAAQVANRLQYLFVDEFQDTGNEVYSIMEILRKIGKSKIYCVGDPEQYIQSFDSTIKLLKNIPILKAAVSNGYDVKLNKSNFRCSQNIITLLNNFNGRIFDEIKFEQVPQQKTNKVPKTNIEPAVYFIKTLNNTISPAIDQFYALCDNHQIVMDGRCLLAKQETLVKRIISAVNRKFMNPKKKGNISLVTVIRDTVLYMLNLNTEEFYKKYNKTAHDLRKLAVELFHAIRLESITDENSFGIYLRDNHDLVVIRKMLSKIEDFKVSGPVDAEGGTVTVANIHTIKGLEHEAVFAITKTELELLAWLEIDREKRDADKEDFCRIGYVAFSRAERLLCISCMETLSESTEQLISGMGIQFLPQQFDS
jgi:DNA helicase-2/ATP-dependent DNA helicase PcrA